MTATPALLSILFAAEYRGDARLHNPPNLSRITMPPSAQSAAEVERLSKNAPAELSDRRVVVFNIWKREYTRADGSQASGPAAVLSVSDGAEPVETVVGDGSRVTIGADTYDVIGVTDDEVVLRRANP